MERLSMEDKTALGVFLSLVVERGRLASAPCEGSGAAYWIPLLAGSFGSVCRSDREESARSPVPLRKACHEADQLIRLAALALLWAEELRRENNVEVDCGTGLAGLVFELGRQAGENAAPGRARRKKRACAGGVSLLC